MIAARGYLQGTADTDEEITRIMTNNHYWGLGTVSSHLIPIRALRRDSCPHFTDKGSEAPRAQVLCAVSLS